MSANTNLRADPQAQVMHGAPAGVQHLLRRCPMTRPSPAPPCIYASEHTMSSGLLLVVSTMSNTCPVQGNPTPKPHSRWPVLPQHLKPVLICHQPSAQALSPSLNFNLRKHLKGKVTQPQAFNHSVHESRKLKPQTRKTAMFRSRLHYSEGRYARSRITDAPQTCTLRKRSVRM